MNYKSQYLHIGNPHHFPVKGDIIYLDNGKDRFIIGGTKEIHDLIHDLLNLYSHSVKLKIKEDK